MASDEQIRLRDLGEMTAGPSGSLLDRLNDGPDGIPVVSPSDITDRHTVDTRRLRRVPWDDAKKLARFSLQEGDIVVVRQGSLGRLALIGMERDTWFYGSSCFRIRPRHDLILPAYLTLYLSFPPMQKELLSQALPGTVHSLNSAILSELLITVPPMERQQAIAAIFADIDDQVQVHKDTADRLEALRLAIFDEMLGAVRSACTD